MIVVRGAASRVTLSQEIVRGIDDLNVGQLLSCQIDGRDVHLSMPTVPNIRHGDEVVVAGWMKQGVLHGRAYRNLDTGSYGRWNYEALGLFVTVPLLTGLSAFIFAMIAPPLALLPLFWCAREWWKAYRTYRAYHAVLAETGIRSKRSDHFLTSAQDHAADRPEEPLPIELAQPVPTANVRFPCPHCGKSLKMSPQALGKRVRCPSRNCGAVIDTSRSSS